MTHHFHSRTDRTPSRNYKRRHVISSHALERFRERVDEAFRHRDDSDLGNLLDERVCHAESTYEVRDPREPEAITTLCSVRCHRETCYAVIRDQTVITVLDEQMAQNNFAGQWSPVLNTPFAKLRDMKIPVKIPTILVDDGGTASPAHSVGKKESSPSPEHSVGKTESSPTTSPPAEDPLAEAGTAYARARRHQHECEDKVKALRSTFLIAEDELREAHVAVDEAHQRLMQLAAKKEEPT